MLELGVSEISYLLKTLTKQIRHLDEECSAIATEAWLELAGEWIEAAAIEIVVVAHV